MVEGSATCKPKRHLPIALPPRHGVGLELHQGLPTLDDENEKKKTLA